MKCVTYTQEYPANTLRLISDVLVVNGTKSCETKALWDTGAKNSAISPVVASMLGLIPQGTALVSSVTTQELSDSYNITVLLRSSINARFENVFATCHPIEKQGIGLIIGMNIISKGDFAISNSNGKTTLSVRFPTQETIDFSK